MVNGRRLNEKLDLKILRKIMKRRNELIDLSIFELAEYSNESPSKITKLVKSWDV